MNSKTSLEIKLIDFGLSYKWEKNMNEEMIKQKKNKLIGTSYYIAP
jgi:serine/threonine protein kinase